MIEIATNRKWSKNRGSGKKDAKYGVYKYDTHFAFPVYGSKGKKIRAKAYDATLVIINSSDGKKYLYDVTEIKENTSVSVILSERENMPANAGQKESVSDTSIPQSAEKSTASAEKVAENSSKLDESARKSMDITPEIEAARGSIVMNLSSYKPKGRKETIEYGKAVGDDAYTRFQIQATNQQAGLEKELKRLGVKNGEAAHKILS